MAVRTLEARLTGDASSLIRAFAESSIASQAAADQMSGDSNRISAALANTATSANNARHHFALMRDAAIILSPSLVSLGQVATGALLGLGAIGGAAALGLGALALAVGPLVSSLNKASAAQIAYQDAVTQFGPKSTQAKAALQAYQKALEGLSPAQVAASKSITGLKDNFKSFQDALSPTVLPLLATGIKIAEEALKLIAPVAKAAGAGLQSFLGDFEKLASSPGAKVFFKDLATTAREAISGLGPILVNLVKGLGSLFEALSPLIAPVLHGIGEMAKAFGNMDFKKFLAPVISSFTQLAPVVAKTLSSLLSVVPVLLHTLAPLGAVILQAFAKILPEVVPIISGLVKALAPLGGAIIRSLVKVVEALVPVFGVLAKVIEHLAPVIIPLAKSLGGLLVEAIKVLTPLLVAVGKVLIAIAPSIVNLARHLGGALVSAIAALVPGVIALVKAIGPLLVTAIKALAPLLPALVPIFAAVGKIIVSVAKLLPDLAPLIVTLGKALVALAPVLAKIIGFLGSALIAAITPLLPVLVKLVDSVVTFAVNALPSLLPGLEALFKALAPLWPQLGQLLTAMLPLLPVVEQLAGIFINSLAPILELILPPLSKLIFLATQFSIWLFDHLAPALKAVAGWLDGLSDHLEGLHDSWKNVWEGIKRIAADVWHGIYDGFVHPLVDFFTKTIPDTFDKGVSFFAGLPGRLKNALGDIVGTVFHGLLAVADWFGAHVLHPAVNWFAGLPGKLFTAVGDIVGTVFHALLGVADWFDSHVLHPAVHWFYELPGRIFDGLGDITGRIFKGLENIGGWLDQHILKPALAWFTKLAGEAWKAFVGGVTPLTGEAARTARQQELLHRGPGRYPGHALGGITTGPTLGWIGESGTEALIPLRELPKMAHDIMLPAEAPQRPHPAMAHAGETHNHFHLQAITDATPAQMTREFEWWLRARGA